MRIFSSALLISVFATAAQAESLTIGVSAPLTGPNAAYGEQMKAAAEAFVDTLNAHGGLLGHPVELQIEDDECSPKTGVTVAQSFTSEAAMPVIIGPLCSGATSAARDTYKTADHPPLVFTLAQGDVTGPDWPNLLRINPDNKAIANHMAIQAHEKNLKKIGLFFGHDAYGTSMRDALRVALSAQGIGVSEVSYSQREMDFRASRDALVQDKVDGMMIAGYMPEMGLIINQIRETLPDMPILLSGTGTIADIAQMYQCGANDPGLTVAAADNGSHSKDFAVAAQAVEAQGMALKDSAVMTWAALELWTQAVRRAGSAEADAVRGVLMQESLPSILGPMSFINEGSRYGYPAHDSVVTYRWVCNNHKYPELVLP
jgi:branched-chain amino acid transport system substrate-binding protein